MPKSKKYQQFADSERGDSFSIPSQSYAQNEVVHEPEVAGGPMPPAAAIAATKVTMELARHHIISWKIIRETWNKCVDLGLDTTCTELARLLTETAITIQPNDSDLCWAKVNLVIGPLGNHRLFDPGQEIDFESPIGIKGARQKHIAAMVELGKLMQAFSKADAELSASEFQRRFHIMLEACKRQTGEEVCVFNRTEWTLSLKPVVRWKTNNGNWERVGKPVAPAWHRGTYSPSSVAKYWSPGMDRDGLYARTAKLRSDNHTAFIQSLGNDTKKATWRFLTVNS
jgi:hypothetical protein